jgi:hypothetical protein
VEKRKVAHEHQRRTAIDCDLKRNSDASGSPPDIVNRAQQLVTIQKLAT